LAKSRKSPSHLPSSRRSRGGSGGKPWSGPRPLYVLSDSTGNLGRHIVTAILTQFPPDAFRIETRGFLRTEKQIREVMDQVKSRPGVVFHGLLEPAHKQLVTDQSAAIGVGSCDFAGPFVDFVSRQSGLTPGRNYELLHRTDDAYRDRIKALEWTLEHDDALGLDTLGEADIVLVGVSRTSKTPTSVFLAQLGYRVANVALAQQVAPPRQLLELKQRKVIGLVIDPSTLADIRSRRQAQWRMGDTNYTEPREVQREVAWSRQLFARQGWPTLDVTNQAVEETAARIVQVLGLAHPAGAAAEASDDRSAAT
jgi:[pyruvate, water dikinase]-phosphate phosphotransferase / [pyruvate, water dikinase] kinase